MELLPHSPFIHLIQGLFDVFIVTRNEVVSLSPCSSIHNILICHHYHDDHADRDDNDDHH